MKISGIIFNWFATTEIGEEYNNVEVGNEYHGATCLNITEHRAAGEGDKWYYDIEYSDGSIQRIFNPNQVMFNP